MDGVMGDRFCLNYPVDLIVKRKKGFLSHGRFEAFDINEQPLLHVDKRTFARSWVMHDPAGLDILSITEEFFSLPQRWMVHKGSSRRGNLLFNAGISSAEISTLMVDMKMNTRNFQVKGSHSSNSFNVYEDNDVFAEVKQSDSTWRGEKYTVRVCAGVDYALIVALIVIMDARSTNNEQHQHHHHDHPHVGHPHVDHHHPHVDHHHVDHHNHATSAAADHHYHASSAAADHHHASSAAGC